MNIIQQTSIQLTFLFSANTTTLECQRTKPTQITCQRTITGLLGTETTLIPGQVTGASVITANGVGVVLSTLKDQCR